jgi:hypothetical protein
MNGTGVGHATEERGATCRAVRPYDGVHNIVSPSGLLQRLVRSSASRVVPGCIIFLGN